jgi:hypothetical protein
MIFVSGNSVVKADDIHVVSDDIYYCSEVYVNDCKIDEYQVGYAYISRLYLNEARNLTPPIKELVVQVETTESSNSLYGYLEAVSPSGLRVAPSEFTDSSIDCNGDKSIGHSCTISSTKKGRSYYTCSYPKNCYQGLFFYALKFPLGSESGPWNLELSVYWNATETVGTVTQTVKKSKKITFPNALIIAPTASPTTTTSTPAITTTTISTTATTQTSPTSPQLAKIGGACSRLNAQRTISGKKVTCRKISKKLVWTKS